jgi:hypothetical protein
LKSWRWVAQYGVAILLALLLGAILGNLALFKHTALGGTKINASRLVQFLGFGGSLFLLWLLGRRAALQLPESGNALSFLHHVLTPLATLIVVSAGYQVFLLLGDPFLGRTGKTIYNWIFIIGIMSAALWLILVWFLRSAPLMESIETLGRAEKTVDPHSSISCPKCSRPIASGMRFCGQCGASVG